jgi:hypothetical protein
MVELLDRRQILKLNRTFASFIAEVQDAKYNPTLDYNKYKPGEMYVDDSDKPRFVSQEECDKWNAEAFAKYLNEKDDIEPFSLKDKHTGEVTYTLSQTIDIDCYVDNLANTMVALCDRLNWKAVVFLFDYSIPWLYQDSDYKPVKKALDYLKSIGVDNNFNGGFKASRQDIKELTKNLFWLIRCNAALPTCYFSGIVTDFTANICKHGNIHFHFYSQQDKINIGNLATDLGMVDIENGDCYNTFSETGVIEGRQITI